MSSPCPPPPAAGCPYILLYLLATLHKARRHLPRAARYYSSCLRGFLLTAPPSWRSIHSVQSIHERRSRRSGVRGVRCPQVQVHCSVKRCASRWSWRLRPRLSVGGATRTSRAAEHRRTPTRRHTRMVRTDPAKTSPLLPERWAPAAARPRPARALPLCLPRRPRAQAPRRITPPRTRTAPFLRLAR